MSIVQLEHMATTLQNRHNALGNETECLKPFVHREQLQGALLTSGWSTNFNRALRYVPIQTTLNIHSLAHANATDTITLYQQDGDIGKKNQKAIDSIIATNSIDEVLTQLFSEESDNKKNFGKLLKYHLANIRTDWVKISESKDNTSAPYKILNPVLAGGITIQDVLMKLEEAERIYFAKIAKESLSDIRDKKLSTLKTSNDSNSKTELRNIAKHLFLGSE